MVSRKKLKDKNRSKEKEHKVLVKDTVEFTDSAEDAEKRVITSNQRSALHADLDTLRESESVRGP